MHKFLMWSTFCLFASTAGAATRFERVTYTNSQRIVLAGVGVTLPASHETRQLNDSRGNPVLWHAKGPDVDETGKRRRHIAHHQVVRTPWGEALVDGSEIRLHFDDEGVLRFASGSQVVSVALENEVRFEPTEAPGRLVAALQRGAHGQMKPGKFKTASDATLVLATSGTESRLGYDIEVVDEDGMPYRVRIDASSEAVLQIVPLFARGNCAPDTSQYNTATGTPVRYGSGGVFGTRPLGASNVAYGTTRPGGEVYEGTYDWPFYAAVNVFHQTTTSDLYCANGGVKAYTLFPVPQISGARVYENLNGWNGRNAGDAMYFSNETMMAFSAFNRDGWNGIGGAANITVSAAAGPIYMASNASPHGPWGVIMGIMDPMDGYGWEAALDVIAHEYGHGFAYTGWPYGPNLSYTGTQAELHEGFGDVIGHIVEKNRQTAGWSVEQSSDWYIGEDAHFNDYLRRADADDGDGGSRFHAADAVNAGTAWANGNMMHVAFRVLADGGRNPYCVTNDTQIGCSSSNANQGLGVQKASNIMIYALANYVTSNATWAGLANQVRAAAKDLYTNCAASTNREATLELDEINKAFGQIGYADSLSFAPRCN